MVDLEHDISGWIRHIEPTRSQKDGARRSQNFLRDILCTGQMGERIVTDYLSGSYSRQTAIYPLDDVDIIFVIRPEAFIRGIVARVLFSRPDPQATLDSFARAIRYRYPDSSVRVQRRSVGLRLYHLDIDVVPAIEDEGDHEVIYIPDREAEDWIKTAPRKHGAIAAEINASCGQKFKPLVKLMKNWNAGLPENARLKSFAIETIAARLFRKISFERYGEGVLLFLDFLAHLNGRAAAFEWKESYGMSMNWWDTQILDLAGTRNNVVAGVNSERRERFLSRAIKSRDLLLSARKARTYDRAVSSAKEALNVNW